MVCVAMYLDPPESQCNKRQECIPVGCVLAARRPYAGVCFPGDVCSRGVSAPGGGGCLLPGVSALGGCIPVSQHALRQTPSPLWTEFLTHACENITLANFVAASNKRSPQINFGPSAGYVHPFLSIFGSLLLKATSQYINENMNNLGIYKLN